MAVSDWDWKLNNTTKSLDPSWYKTEPTSLKLLATGVAWKSLALSRHADTLILPQGQIITWMKRGTNLLMGVCFRNQSALGNPTNTNYYCVRAYAGAWGLYAIVNGNESLISSLGTSLNNGEEGRFKFTWWNGENPSGNPALAVAIYKDDGEGNFVLQGTIFDTNNRWKDSSQNRCGLEWNGGGNNYGWYEDTELYKPES